MQEYHNDVACYGESTGSASFVVDITTGTPPYSYLWSNGDTSSIISNLIAGMYYCTVTDNNGCSYTDSVLISQPNLPLLTNISGVSHVACYGDSSGQAIINVSGGSWPYSYSWNNGDTNNTVINLTAGNNVCTVVDNHGCIRKDSVLINQNDEIIIYTTITDSVLCNGDTTGSIILDSITGGVPSYLYIWSTLDTVNIIDSLVAGNYDIMVTDTIGCQKIKNIEITQPDAISTTTDSLYHIKCFGEATGYAEITIAGGITDYNVYSNTTNSSFTLSGGITKYNFYNYPAGTHLYTVTDNNNCTYTDSITLIHLTDSLHFTVTLSDYNGVNISCKGYSDGWISIDSSLGGLPPYSFGWSNGDTSAYVDSLSVGWYNAILTDDYGCTFSKYLQITEPLFALETLLDTFTVSCNGYCDGVIIANTHDGTSPYTFEWYDNQMNLISTNDTLDSICAGTYNLTVNDINGCLNYATTTISEPNTISVTLNSISHVTINGISDGAIDINTDGGNGGYIFYWTGPNGFVSIGGTSNEDISGLSAGTYFVVVNDQLGCYSDTMMFIINEPPAISINIDSLQSMFTTSCYDDCDGKITINPVLSPSVPFTVLWIGPNGFQSTNPNIIDSLCAGNYLLNIITSTDTLSFNFTIIEPDLLEVAIGTDSITCNGGTALTTAYTYGGTLPYEFLWSNNSINISTFLPLGTHYVEVIDAHGCTISDSISLDQPAAMVLNSSATDTVSCYNWSDGVIDIQVNSGGNPPYLYSLDQFITQQNNSTFTNLSPGNYIIGIKDILGCIAYDSIVINNALPFTVSTVNPAIYADTVECNGDCNGTVQFNYFNNNGSTASIVQQWSGGNTNTNLCPGTYSCIFTDIDGCQATLNNIVIYDAPVIMVDSTNTNTVTCYNNGNDGAAFVLANPYYGNSSNPVPGTMSYRWPTITYGGLYPNGYDANDPSDLTPGTYECIITDQNGCTISEFVTIGSNNTPFIIEIIYNGLSLTTGQVQPAGTVINGFEWNTGANTQSINNLINGQYWLIVTDTYGCVSDTAFYNLQDSALEITTVNINKTNIFPNPTNGMLFLESDLKIQEINIFNSIGEKIINKTYNNNTRLNNYKFDLSGLSKGVYYLKINNEMFIHKIILE